uniref:Uncharacterized protein n=1 Tax=Anguilla anguilla TaxID=7936 RepID=A0A0E9TA59_ANGAN
MMRSVHCSHPVSFGWWRLIKDFLTLSSPLPSPRSS